MTGLLALAFTAGMLAPVNPCGFALLPAYLTHAIADAPGLALPARLMRALRAGTALTLGFAGTLAAAGLAVSAGARAVIRVAPWLGLATGVVLLALGVVFLVGRTLGLRLPAVVSRRPASSAAGSVTGLTIAGVGYAAASLSCSFGILLAVIAQAQTTASLTGLLVVFAAYAAGSAAVLLLVSLASAAAGAALTRRLATLARHGTRLTGAVLVATGAYLALYWLPAGGGGAAGGGVTRASAIASTWLQTHTTAVAVVAVTAVVSTALTAGIAGRRRQVTPADSCCPPGQDDCCPAGQPAQSACAEDPTGARTRDMSQGTP